MCSHQKVVILIHQPLHLSHHMGRHILVARQAHRREPELALAVGRRHVNVGRLMALVGVEVEAKRANAQDGRYSYSLYHRKEEMSRWIGKEGRISSANGYAVDGHVSSLVLWLAAAAR